MSLWHWMVRTADGLPIFVDRAMRLRAIRHLARYLGARTLWFGFSDNHVHFVIEADPGKIRRIGRDLVGILRRLSARTFQPPFAQPIENQRHLLNCWPYVVANLDRHGVPGNALLDDGSGLADVIGARILPGFDPTTWAKFLPRRGIADKLVELKLPANAGDTAPIELVRELGAVALARAAAACVGWVDLTSDAPLVVHARAAVVDLGFSAGVARAEIGHALAQTRSSLWRLNRRPVTALRETILRRISFEDAASSRQRHNRNPSLTVPGSHG